MSTTINDRFVRGQVMAMKCRVFEVGAYKPAEPGNGPQEPEMFIRTWDADGLLRSVAWLRLQNLRGRNIYIRPHGEHSLSLLDDLTFESIERMKSEGFGPALVVETSLGNFQAWVNHGEVLPQYVSTQASKILSQKFFGDPSSADWRHFGRLAGFTNRKPKYRREDGLSPFVKLIEASGKVYPQAQAFVAEIRKACAAKQQTLSRWPFREPQNRPSQLQTIADFRRKPQYAEDGNRIDLAYAIYALSHGASEGEVRAAVATRDLNHKGAQKRQSDYIDRTIQKARSAIQGQGKER